VVGNPPQVESEHPGPGRVADHYCDEDKQPTRHG
jgi:hypothetical protein